MLKRLHDDHRYSADPLGALAEFNAVLEKANKQTVRELSRKTPDCIGRKLLIASTALRAYRNRHLGTLMRCCEAWKPVANCFDPMSFECADLQRLGQIIANVTRASLAERVAEIANLPWTQTEKDNALARCRIGQRAWRTKKPVLCLSAVTDEDGHPLETEDESGRRLCEYWGSIFQARVKGPRHHQNENILRYVQEALDDIRWTIDRTEFDILHLVPMGFHMGLADVREGLGSQFLFNANKYLLEGGTAPEHFAGRGTVSLPKTSDIDDNGRIIRSRDALRPLTLCNCDCQLLTSAVCRGLHRYTMRCIHPSQRCVSSRQMTDNIFEIETTALAHVACGPQESGILLTDFAAAHPSANHSWILSLFEKTELPGFICRFLRSIYSDSTTHVEFAGATQGQCLMARGVRQGCLASGFLLAIAFDPIFRWLQEAIIPRNSHNLEFLQPVQCAYADDLAVAASSFRDLMTALAPAFHSVDYIAGLNLNYHECCWVQYGSEGRESLCHCLSENCVESSVRCKLSDTPSTLGP